MPKLFLMGYFGAGNFGDDVLLVAWLKRHRHWLTNRAVTCDILSHSPRPLENFASEAELAPLIGRVVAKDNSWQLNCGDYAALVAPGGSLLQDKTSLRSLLFYLNLIRRFRSAKRPVFLLHQGLGPLGGIGSWLTKQVLRKTNYLSLRDKASYEWCLHQLPRGPELALAADPILAAQFTLPEFASVKPQIPYALLIPKATGALPSKTDPTPEPAALSRTLSALGRTSRLRMLVAALHSGQDEDLCRQIVAGVPQAGVAVPQPPTANHFWGLICQASLVISYRLHGLIAAAACNVPAFGVAYDPKVSAFCDEIGLPWCRPEQIHSDDTQMRLVAYCARLETEAQSLPERKAVQLGRLEAASKRFSLLLEGLA